MVEPWLRGTLTEIDPVRRQVVHALLLAGEDLDRWCGALSDSEVVSRPFGIASVAFHVRHIAGSLDRLLTYSEGRELNEDQLQALADENAIPASRARLMNDLHEALERAITRILEFALQDLQETRTVGRDHLPTTLAGLLIHTAEHTQRHVGQAITASQVIQALRDTQV